VHRDIEPPDIKIKMPVVSNGIYDKNKYDQCQNDNRGKVLGHKVLSRINSFFVIPDLIRNPGFKKQRHGFRLTTGVLHFSHTEDREEKLVAKTRMTQEDGAVDQRWYQAIVTKNSIKNIPLVCNVAECFIEKTYSDAT
jgi:hypothetical protein